MTPTECHALEAEDIAPADDGAGEGRLPADEPVGDGITEGELGGAAVEDGAGQALRGRAESVAAT